MNDKIVKIEGMEPIGVYYESPLTIYVYDIRYDVNDEALIGWANDDTAEWCEIKYDGDGGDSYCIFSDRIVPFDEVMKI